MIIQNDSEKYAFRFIIIPDKELGEILGGEFYMTNPLVRYILLVIILLVLFLRTLSWLQYLYLKHELKKRFTKLV